MRSHHGSARQIVALEQASSLKHATAPSSRAPLLFYHAPAIDGRKASKEDGWARRRMRRRGLQLASTPSCFNSILLQLHLALTDSERSLLFPCAQRMASRNAAQAMPSRHVALAALKKCLEGTVHRSFGDASRNGAPPVTHQETLHRRCTRGHEH